MLFFIPSVWLIFPTILEYRENDVGHLSGYFDYGFLRFHGLLVSGIGHSQSVISVDGYPRSLYNHRSEMLVATEGLLSACGFLSTIMTGRYQAEITGELVLVTESLHIVDFCQYAHGYTYTYAGYRHQKLVIVPVPVGLRKPSYGFCRVQECLAYRLHLLDEQVQRQS